MDIGTMAALGMFDSDDNEGGATGMSDLQFKAFFKAFLVFAQTTREVKEFKKGLGSTDWGAFAPYTSMIINIADATGDMEKVKKVFQDILKM
jgi:hypothetical protein